MEGDVLVCIVLMIRFSPRFKFKVFSPVFGFPFTLSPMNTYDCHLCCIAITSENCLDNCTAVETAEY